jgi:carboxymethylenebutenolidase
MSEHETSNQNDQNVGRREFVGMSVVAAGLAVSAGSALGAMEVVESDVTIKTKDGNADCAYIHPKSGSHAAVIIWPDAFGLRPSMRAIGRRVAAEGYTVLVPNPFYRVAKDPFTDASTFSFSKPEDRAKLGPLMGSIGAAGACETDAMAYIAWLDSQKEVNKKKKIGTQGYCMGGPLVVRTCAVAPDRMGAGGSFHGGGLVTKGPDSPHLLASKINAKMYFGVAKNDDAQQPDAKDKLKEVFGPKAEVEVYSSLHGWCVPDMPPNADGAIYNKADAEKAWGKLVALYKTGLA